MAKISFVFFPLASRNVTNERCHDSSLWDCRKFFPKPHKSQPLNYDDFPKVNIVVKAEADGHG